MASKSTIELGGRRYNAEWLRSLPEGQAVNHLRGHCDENQVRNAWKQANGKTVRNYSKPESVEKPTTEKKKRARKPNSESDK